MIQAKIVADSLNPQGDRLTTFIVTFPRIILAEFNTHRMFSRNSASSRAIPFDKMVKSVQENPFIPIVWQKDHKGMQGKEYLTDELSINFATSKNQ
jgi:thymidylate synthase ThyX